MLLNNRINKYMNTKQPIIVHIAPYYPPHIGGLENVAKMSAEELAKRNYVVRVITSTSSGVKRGVEKIGNLQVTSLASFEFARTPIAPMLLWELLTLPKNSIIHLHFSQAYWPELILLVAKLRNIPYLIHFHLDVKPSGFFGCIFVIYKKLLWGPMLRNAEKVIACSQDQIKVIHGRYKVPMEDIVLISNAVAEKFFAKGPYSSHKEIFNLLYVGRIVLQKRVDRIIEAVAKLSIPVHLSIVGDGYERKKLEHLVKKLHLSNVTFEGQKTSAEIINFHKKNHALVISSDEEGTSLVMLEAMAAGLPIIGTNVKGIDELTKGVGILVDEPYVENFSIAIKELWSNPKKLEILSKQSVEKAKQYSWTRFIKQLEAVYSSIKP